jgi:hypothetical protein
MHSQGIAGVSVEGSGEVNKYHLLQWDSCVHRGRRTEYSGEHRPSTESDRIVPSTCRDLCRSTTAAAPIRLNDHGADD